MALDDPQMRSPADAALILDVRPRRSPSTSGWRTRSKATEAESCASCSGRRRRCSARSRVGRRAGRLCALVLHVLDLPGPARHLARGPVRRTRTMRGKGIGKALLVDLAQRCVREASGGSSGRCSTGTSPRSISTRRRARVILDDWGRCRVDGEALEQAGRGHERRRRDDRRGRGKRRDRRDGSAFRGGMPVGLRAFQAHDDGQAARSWAARRSRASAGRCRGGPTSS